MCDQIVTPCAGQWRHHQGLCDRHGGAQSVAAGICDHRGSRPARSTMRSAWNAIFAPKGTPASDPRQVNARRPRRWTTRTFASACSTLDPTFKAETAPRPPGGAGKERDRKMVRGAQARNQLMQFVVPAGRRDHNHRIRFEPKRFNIPSQTASPACMGPRFRGRHCVGLRNRLKMRAGAGPALVVCGRNDHFSGYNDGPRRIGAVEARADR